MKRYLIVLLLFVCACSRIPDILTDEDEVMVSMRLVLSDGSAVVCHDAGLTDVRSSESSFSLTTQAEDAIRNFWVVQYDGTSDDAPIIGEPKYFPDMEVFTKPSDEGGHDEQIQMVAADVDNRIVIIANTFDPDMSFPQGSTFGDFKRKLRTVSDNENFLSSDEQGKYVVLSGSVVGRVSQGTVFSCTLERNVAKVSISIRNSSSDVLIKSWQLRSVPSVCYYFTNYELPETYPAVGEFTGVDYPVITPAQSLGKDTRADYMVYLPANKWGARDEVTAEEYKNVYAPNGATYLQINAESGGQPLIYRFYLGGNMTTDFNILPNTSYSYVFEIKSKGDAEFDSRIDEVCLRDFANTNDELANCYVINPAEVDGVLRRFRIPVKRVDEFWGGRGYEDVPDNTLGANGEWKVEILASNFDNSEGNLTFTKQTGVGSYNASTAELQYFEFTVKPETKGSAIVGIRKGAGPILWSWHLWITDYTPDEAYTKTPQHGVYSYGLTSNSGVVHRYEGALWNGEYAKRFIMDRNLGATSVDGTGSLYFQFGRKDPLFGNGTYGSAYYTDIVSSAPEDPLSTIKYSIQNPLKYIYAGWQAWTIGNKYNPSESDGTILWMDPHTSAKSNFSMTRNKSIFDPCPPGYCLPKSGTWSDFRVQTDASPTTNIAPTDYLMRGFDPYNGSDKGNGCRYWPYPKSSDADNVPENPVFYPITGIIQNANGTLGSTGNVYMMSANPHGKDDCYMFYATSLDLQVSRPAMGMDLAGAVRCITSRDAE